MRIHAGMWIAKHLNISKVKNRSIQRTEMFVNSVTFEQTFGFYGLFQCLMWINTCTKSVPFEFSGQMVYYYRIFTCFRFQMLIFNENDDRIKNLSKHNLQLASQIIELMHTNGDAQHTYPSLIAVLLYAKW